MGRMGCVTALLSTLVLAATLQAQGLEEAIEPQEPVYNSPLELENCSTDGEYYRSRVKFTLDAMYRSRGGAGGHGVFRAGIHAISGAGMGNRR